MTRFTQAISFWNGTIGSPIRDLMALVPTALNGAIFDAALHHSMAAQDQDVGGTAPTGFRLRRSKKSAQRKKDIEKNRVSRGFAAR